MIGRVHGLQDTQPLFTRKEGRKGVPAGCMNCAVCTSLSCFHLFHLLGGCELAISEKERVISNTKEV